MPRPALGGETGRGGTVGSKVTVRGERPTIYRAEAESECVAVDSRKPERVLRRRALITTTTELGRRVKDRKPAPRPT